MDIMVSQNNSADAQVWVYLLLWLRPVDATRQAANGSLDP